MCRGSPISHPRQLKQIKPYDQRRISFLAKLVFPATELAAHLVLNHWLRCCAPVTHQDQGLVALRRLAPGCLGSPRKPSVPHRVQLRRSDKLTAQVCGFPRVQFLPLVAHGTGATNSLRIRVGSACGVQSGLMVLPTPWRHCRSRPIKLTSTQRPWPRQRACPPS